MSDIDCHSEMVNFHRDSVTLSSKQQGEMRDRRNAGCTARTSPSSHAFDFRRTSRACRQTVAASVSGSRHGVRKVCAVLAQTGLCGAKSVLSSAIVLRRCERLRTHRARAPRRVARRACERAVSTRRWKRHLFSALSFACCASDGDAS